MTDAISSRRLGHVPVLLTEVVVGIAAEDEKLFVDGTFGRGGHSEALLQGARCRVLALDRDPAAQHRAQELKSKYRGRFTFCLGCFGDLDKILIQQGIHSNAVP